MLCPNCDYNNNENNRFCVRCGVDLSVAPAPGTPSFAVGPAGDPASPAPASPAPASPAPASTAPTSPPAAAPAAAPPGDPAPPNPWGAASSPPPPPPFSVPPPPSAPANPFAPPPAYAPPGAYPPGAYPPGAYGQYPPPYPPSGFHPPSTNGLAIAALVLGLVGWVPCGIGSILAIVLGFVARSQIRSSQGRQGGDGLAIAGIVLGFLAVILFVVFLLIGAISNSQTGQT